MQTDMDQIREDGVLVTELNAQIERLQVAVRALGAMVNFLHAQQSPYYPDALGEDGLSELGLWPDDVPMQQAYPGNCTLD